MKMLFLDTVVMPVLSQMMRGKLILARACFCFSLNTPLFCHQNLHKNTHGHCVRLSWAGRASSGFTHPLDAKRSQQTQLYSTRVLQALRQPRVFKQVKPHSPHSIKPSYPDGFTPAASGASLISLTGGWAHTPPQSLCIGQSCTHAGGENLGGVSDLSTQRRTPFLIFPKTQHRLSENQGFGCQSHDERTQEKPGWDCSVVTDSTVAAP